MGGIYKLIITVCNYIRNNDIQLLNWQVYWLGHCWETWRLRSPDWVMRKLKRNLFKEDSWFLSLQEQGGQHVIPIPFPRRDETPMTLGSWNSTYWIYGCWWGLQVTSTYLRLAMMVFSNFLCLTPISFCSFKTHTNGIFLFREINISKG